MALDYHFLPGGTTSTVWLYAGWSEVQTGSVTTVLTRICLPYHDIRIERYERIQYGKLPGVPEVSKEFELYDLQKDPGELDNPHVQWGCAAFMFLT